MVFFWGLCSHKWGRLLGAFLYGQILPLSWLPPTQHIDTTVCSPWTVAGRTDNHRSAWQAELLLLGESGLWAINSWGSGLAWGVPKCIPGFCSPSCLLWTYYKMGLFLLWLAANWDVWVMSAHSWRNAGMPHGDQDLAKVTACNHQWTFITDHKPQDKRSWGLESILGW